jgi:hypothetical protein
VLSSGLKKPSKRVGLQPAAGTAAAAGGVGPAAGNGLPAIAQASRCEAGMNVADVLAASYSAGHTVVVHEMLVCSVTHSQHGLLGVAACCQHRGTALPS